MVLLHLLNKLVRTFLSLIKTVELQTRVTPRPMWCKWSFTQFILYFYLIIIIVNTLHFFCQFECNNWFAVLVQQLPLCFSWKNCICWTRSIPRCLQSLYFWSTWKISSDLFCPYWGTFFFKHNNHFYNFKVMLWDWKSHENE